MEQELVARVEELMSSLDSAREYKRALYSTSSGVKLKEALKAEKVEGNISEIAVAEISYVLCRKLGSKLDLELKTCCTSFVC
jgi:hypothetical protein